MCYLLRGRQICDLPVVPPRPIMAGIKSFLIRPHVVCRQALIFCLGLSFFLFLTIRQILANPRSGDSAKVYKRFGLKLD